MSISKTSIIENEHYLNLVELAKQIKEDLNNLQTYVDSHTPLVKHALKHQADMFSRDYYLLICRYNEDEIEQAIANLDDWAHHLNIHEAIIYQIKSENDAIHKLKQHYLNSVKSFLFECGYFVGETDGKNQK